MKRLCIVSLLILAAVAASAQPKKVSVLGDSYSTFQGYNPDNYRPFYPDANNDVKEVEQTWWSLYIQAKGYELEKNNSWGATTICGAGFFGRDVTPSCFLSRVFMLGDPDIIFVFGGTNDAWQRVPLGEYKYEGLTKADCMTFRPALAYLLQTLKQLYPKGFHPELRAAGGGQRIHAGGVQALRCAARRTARHRQAERSPVHRRHEEHLRAAAGAGRRLIISFPGTPRASSPSFA